MAWVTDIMASGKTGDVLLEHMSANASNVTLSSGRIVLPMATNNSVGLIKAIVRGGGTFLGPWASTITCLQGLISLSANPTSEIGLITDGFQASTNRIFRIGTDGKLKFYDYLGNFIASSATAISTTAGSPTEFQVFFDALTLSTVWISLFVNGTEEVALNTGLTVAAMTNSTPYGYVGDYTPSGSNFGATVNLENVLVRSTSSTADAPYTVAYPRLLIAGAASITSDGDSVAWPNGTTPGAGSWNDVKEAPNDGDTSRWADIQTSDPKTAHDQLAHWSAANPLGGSETIVTMQAKYVSKLTGAGKNGYLPLIKLGGTAAASSQYGNGGLLAYEGAAGQWTARPAGGAFTPSDMGLTGGVSNIQVGGRSIVASGTSTGPAITKTQGIEAVYYTATLPLARTPGLALAFPRYRNRLIGR